MKKLYSYVVKSDFGFAPNPFWGTMTLNCCKPQIRKIAKVGDWVIGVGSSKVERKGKMDTINYSGNLVFAMLISKSITMREYDRLCSDIYNPLHKKIPCDDKEWMYKVGDCIYDFGENKTSPELRPSMHCESDRQTDLGGNHTLLSEEFYYFGANQIKILKEYRDLIKIGRGHLGCDDELKIQKFAEWLKTLRFNKNDLAEPQLKCDIDDNYNRFQSICTDKKYVQRKV